MGFHLFSNSGQIQYGIKNYIADFKTDLKNIPKNPGNMVFVIEESKYYITNNKQDWVEYKINNSTEESDIEIDITENGSHDISFATTANVKVPQGVFPEGNQIITENGNYDITLKKTVDINVPQGIFPEGTKQINLTSNGTTTEDITNYANAKITVNTDPAKGLVFGDYDADGFPHSAMFVGAWTEIPKNYCNGLFSVGTYTFQKYFSRYVTAIIVPNGVTTIDEAVFYNCSSLVSITLPDNDISIGLRSFAGVGCQEIIFKKNVTFSERMCFDGCKDLVRFVVGGTINAITQNAFKNCKNVILYDFSHCVEIPPLYDVASLGHASGCVIRIPAALSDTTLGEGNGWESETNWSALTDIVWEVI